MKKLFIIFFVIISSAATLAGCGSGGGGGFAVAPSRPTTATTKMYLFGTMSSASAGGSDGVMANINTVISSLPAGVTLTSMVPSGTAAAIPTGNTSSGFIGGTRDFSISLINPIPALPAQPVDVKADTVSNDGKGVEVATLYFSLTGGATPPIPTPGTTTTVFQYRTGPTSIKEINGCVVNFTTTYH